MRNELRLDGAPATGKPGETCQGHVSQARGESLQVHQTRFGRTPISSAAASPRSVRSDPQQKSAVLEVIPRRRFLLPAHSIPLFPLLYHRSRPAQIRKGGTRPARPSFNLMPAIPAGPPPPPQSCCPPAVQSPPSRTFAARRPRSSPSPAAPAQTAASWVRCSTRRFADGGR